MTWDGLVTKYHKKYIKELDITNNIKAYIQSKVLKKTLKRISLNTEERITMSIKFKIKT